MSSLEWKRIRVDWEELLEAFEDGSTDHRYYLDRETGAVHFFSEYLDNEEEEEPPHALTILVAERPRPTMASLFVRGPHEVYEFLSSLAAIASALM